MRMVSWMFVLTLAFFDGDVVSKRFDGLYYVCDDELLLYG